MTVLTVSHISFVGPTPWYNKSNDGSIRVLKCLLRDTNLDLIWAVNVRSTNNTEEVNEYDFCIIE